MDVRRFTVPFFVVVAIVALLVASPALSRVLVLPRTELLTELWILDSGHLMKSYPYNISSGQGYGVYLGIGNRLGHCAYYVVEVKFRNQTQSAPTVAGSAEEIAPSGLPSLFNVTAFVADEGVREMPLTFSFVYGFSQSLMEVEFCSLTLNDVVLDLHGSTSAWNATQNTFYGNLIFELWLFNPSTSAFQYHQRYVGLKLNMTV